MSYSVTTEFWSDDPNFVRQVEKYALKIFEPINFSKQAKNDYWSMIIYELELKEALPILDELKKKFGITFIISYGVY